MTEYILNSRRLRLYNLATVHNYVVGQCETWNICIFYGLKSPITQQKWCVWPNSENPSWFSENQKLKSDLWTGEDAGFSFIFRNIWQLFRISLYTSCLLRCWALQTVKYAHISRFTLPNDGIVNQSQVIGYTSPWIQNLLRHLKNRE